MFSSSWAVRRVLRRAALSFQGYHVCHQHEAAAQAELEAAFAVLGRGGVRLIAQAQEAAVQDGRQECVQFVFHAAEGLLGGAVLDGGEALGGGL